MAGRFSAVMTRPARPDHLDIGVFKGPIGPLRRRCPLCWSSSLRASVQLLRCSGCRSIYYCGPEHQAAHRPHHKLACTTIKKARARLAKEEHDVRNAMADPMTPANAFETAVGEFWEIMNTRDYMRARNALARFLSSIGTLDGVEESLEHLRDMLRLSREDYIGARLLIPAIMLRLDLDQECYDFMKWWLVSAEDENYDWSDPTAPYIDLRGADVLEDPRPLLRKNPELNFVVALLILNLKLLVDIRNIKVTRKALSRRQLPNELRDLIEREAIRSPLSVKFQRGAPESLIEIEKTILKNTRHLGTILNETSDTFLPNLFFPEKALTERPMTYLRGSLGETALVIQDSYATWWETEGVLGLVDAANGIVMKDLRVTDDLLMTNERPKNLILHCMKLTWTYLDWAFEDASYLGPWSERPSVQHIKNKEGQARPEEEVGEYTNASDDEEWTDDEY
ncbi:hypothetical protein F5Y09DRAFT_326102 [Xylaria sp. FL1042]|nr:hypothetical protein F5Y09DRAFT_326102 [Xylaria sp. FL1042]